ncbi:methylenetetrahydrofolate reductase [NAD(P)H] [Ruminococcus flavefaciens]|uniref:Methylenetetrahydrofolate reductase n=1 Tax=Ruminococcus flavefaciens 007c TaxID=1341157 RepID=W7UU54_RUMFL|nr:methylenetetrahydrofolate reductase [NAD(P)H] [Ruminococcus flavefaciens]EWM54689.1 5,10-methylenetetrahydrofolate reductase [Ruminococcus flavefaciens 007c]
MYIKELFKNKTVFSFEVFPPKKTSPVEVIYDTLEELQGLSPDFISVTFGAGGSGNSRYALEIASKINESGIIPMLHLPCINFTKAEIDAALDEAKSRGIENILALRGDINPEIEPVNDFRYASDLISYIKTNGDFDIAAACYPECHPDAENLVEDITNLRKKVDAGADHLITQLFFDNDNFYSFREKAAIAGINVPIEAGIMPVVNKKQIERMVTTCGASLPAKFVRIMTKYEHNPEALRDAGIAYAVNQIIDLVASGVDGIHLYTMNNPYVARKISEAVSGVIGV